MAFPEGIVPDAELGFNQFASLLSREGLTATDVTGRVLPRLVESWSWENDGLRLRVRLRPGVLFHDGTPLVSSSIADILRTAVARQDAHAAYPSLGDITGIRPDGELELVVELARRSGFLLEDLTMPVTREGIGTGPYKIVARTDTEIRLEAFDKYYLGTPNIRRISLQTFDTLRAAWTSFLRNEVDLVTDVSAEAVEFVEADTVDVITYKRWYQFMVLFNSKRPPFTSRSVRRALNLAVDRERLIARALKGFGTPSTGPVWPEHWAYDASVPSYQFDPADVKSLLDAGGSSPRTERLSATAVPSARVRFTCLLPANFSLLERIALETQRQLYDVGVDMQFEVVPLEEYLRRLQAGDFQSALVDMISGPSLGRLYIFWRSARHFRGFNNFGFENPEAESLFEVLRTSSTNDAAVRSATSRLQRVFLEDPPALFLAWNQRTRAVNNSFQVVADAGRDPMPTLWQWGTTRDSRTAAN